jgi:hypothetical protein
MRSSTRHAHPVFARTLPRDLLTPARALLIVDDVRGGFRLDAREEQSWSLVGTSRRA